MNTRNVVISALASAALLIMGAGTPPITVAGTPVVLETGHADVVIGYAEGVWDLHAHDTAGEYDPADTTLRALPLAESAVPNNPGYAFLGAAGTPIWVLPQAPNPNLLFLGISAEEITSGVFVGDQVNLTLKSVSGPGHFFVYNTELFGSPVVRFNSADGITAADTLARPVGAHGHYNWAFTAPGSYEIGVEASGTLVAGNTPTSSGTVVYRFEVQAIGGKNFRIGTGSIDLDWRPGNVQADYLLVRYNTSTTEVTFSLLPSTASSYSDTSAVEGVVYCYLLVPRLAVGGGAYSDLECAMTGLQTATHAPGAFKLALNQTANATMTWTAPEGGVDSYLLQRIPLDGSPITTVPLPAAATTTTQAVVPAGTCFHLLAFKGAAYGGTNLLCGLPGVSSLRLDETQGKRVSATEALGDIRERLSQVRLPEASTWHNTVE